MQKQEIITDDQINTACGINIMTTRERALDWWGSLTDTQKWENRNKVTILDGRTWQNLTGREIEIIWKRCFIAFPTENEVLNNE